MVALYKRVLTMTDTFVIHNPTNVVINTSTWQVVSNMSNVKVIKPIIRWTVAGPGRVQEIDYPHIVTELLSPG